MTLDPKQLCKNAGYRSIEQLAVKVRELWDEPEPGAKPRPRSLATRIGALARPDGAGWWNKRPLASAHLEFELMRLRKSAQGANVGEKSTRSNYFCS
ncbi:hypothetical protein [Enhygromyxa salina]|uniref:hypothetical protein n=1 Tax=Enhygromyxa salina TaxID=215803 RepID=UPI000695F197|nr:hypothetical protein [Enhygromyxa salina]